MVGKLEGTGPGEGDGLWLLDGYFGEITVMVGWVAPANGVFNESSTPIGLLFEDCLSRRNASGRVRLERKADPLHEVKGRVVFRNCRWLDAAEFPARLTAPDDSPWPFVLEMQDCRSAKSCCLSRAIRSGRIVSNGRSTTPFSVRSPPTAAWEPPAFDCVSSPLADLRIVCSARLPMGHHRHRMSTEEEPLPNELKFCDYASAGNTWDGRSAYSPDGKWMSMEGYWDELFNRHWSQLRLSDGAVCDEGAFYVPEAYRGTYWCCDLYARYRPNGRQIAFNSVHDGSRQVYVRDIE